MNNFKNEIDKIIIPNDIDSVVKKAMRKGRHKIIKKRIIISVVVICLLFTSLFGTCYVYPSAADILVNVPFVGSMFMMFTDKDLKIATEKGLTDLSTQQQTKDGITVFIKEIYYDRTMLSVGIAVKGKNPYNFNTYFSVYYNDKKVSSSTSGENIEVTKDIFYRTINIPLINDISDKCNVKLVGTDATGLNRKYEFDIPIDFSKVDPLSKEFTLMKTFKNADRVILVKNIIFTPVSTVINYEYTSPKDEQYNLQLLDKNNRELGVKGGSGPRVFNGNFKTDACSAFFEPLSSIPQYLTLNIVSANGSEVLDSVRHAIMSMKLELQ